MYRYLQINEKKKKKKDKKDINDNMLLRTNYRINYDETIVIWNYVSYPGYV